MKVKFNAVLSAIQLLSALLAPGAIVLFAPVCSKLLDLANGSQMHMKCYFSGQAGIAIGVILAALALVSLFAGKDYVKIQLATLVADGMLLLVFHKLIGVCAGAQMDCRSTLMWITGAAIASGIAALIGIFRSKEGQIPS